MERRIKRGDMYYANLSYGVGSEQSGFRPALIISNNTGNKHSGTVIAAAVTSKTKGTKQLPTHCKIYAGHGLPMDSFILLEQIRTIDKDRLREYIGTLDAGTMNDVDKALAISVGLK